MRTERKKTKKLLTNSSLLNQWYSRNFCLELFLSKHIIRRILQIIDDHQTIGLQICTIHFRWDFISMGVIVAMLSRWRQRSFPWHTRTLIVFAALEFKNCGRLYILDVPRRKITAIKPSIFSAKDAKLNEPPFDECRVWNWLCRILFILWKLWWKF